MLLEHILLLKKYNFIVAEEIKKYQNSEQERFRTFHIQNNMYFLAVPDKCDDVGK